MLGQRNGGFKIAMNALNVGRIKLGVACLEAQRRVITGSVKYANERVQFKKPIASSQCSFVTMNDFLTPAEFRKEAVMSAHPKRRHFHMRQTSISKTN